MSFMASDAGTEIEALHPMSHTKKIGLLSAAGIGITTVIGSGWLFSSYYASKIAGPASILSWIIGGIISILMGLALAELSTLHPERGLFARLLSISHNRDFGFITAISNWLSVLIIIPSEAEATIQYLSSLYHPITNYIYLNNNLTDIGIGLVAVLVLIYFFLNYWGIRLLVKFNNTITLMKVIVPSVTVALIMVTAFHVHNFTADHQKFIPYGYSSIFSAVVNSGIFYAFYGFQILVNFAGEIKKPSKNIPGAIVLCIVLCTLIYIALQVAFIGGLPPASFAKGWHHLSFTSPLVQLTGLLGLNIWSIVLYADAALSPSGTGITYLGSGSRMLTAMSQECQMPGFFKVINPQFNFSRRSLIVTLLCIYVFIFFFRSWQSLVMIITILMLLSCLAIPIAFVRLRLKAPLRNRPFRLKAGKTISTLLFLLLTFLLLVVEPKLLLLAFLLHVILFAVYGISKHRSNMKAILHSFLSAISLFIYLAFITTSAYLKPYVTTSDGSLVTYYVLTLSISLVLFVALVRQKSYCPEPKEEVVSEVQT